MNMDWGHVDEHGEEMALSPSEYFDLELEEIRRRTFRVEDLKDEGYGSRPHWEGRFAHWAEVPRR